MSDSKLSFVTSASDIGNSENTKRQILTIITAIIKEL